MFLDSSEIAKRSGRIVVNTGGLWTNVNSLADLFRRPLPELPWQVMTSPVKLKVLVALEAFVADLTHETIRSEKSSWR